MPEQSNDYRVVVFGAGGVGKTSRVLRFIKGTFRESYILTIEDTYRQVGNALVCIAVYTNYSMRTVTNIFIVNLAVADFFVILFCLPPTVVWDVTETWFMGKAMCKVVIYFQVVRLGGFSSVSDLGHGAKVTLGSLECRRVMLPDVKQREVMVL